MTDEVSSANDFALARSIMRRGAPNIAREYYEMVLASEDPEDYRKYLETVHKLEGKEQGANGTPVQIIIDLGSSTPTLELVPQVVEAVEQAQLPAPVQADPLIPHMQPTAAPAVQEDDIFDMSSLLGDH